MAKYNAALSRDVSQLGDDFFRAAWGYLLWIWSYVVALGESFLRFLDVLFHAVWGCIVPVWNFFHDIPRNIFSFIYALGARFWATIGEFSGEKLWAGVYHQWEVWSANESARIAFTIFAYFLVSFVIAKVFFKIGERFLIWSQIDAEYSRRTCDEFAYCMLVGIHSAGAIAVYNHFGLIAFFVVTGLYLTLLQVLNNTATLSTWMLIDEQYKNDETYNGYTALGVHFFAYVISFVFFVHTQEFLSRNVIAHQNVFPSVCPIADANLSSWSDFLFYCFFELCSGFGFRVLMRYVHLPQHTRRRLFVPWIYAALIAAGQHMFGVQGTHPGIVYARIFPCWLVMGFQEGCGAWVIFVMACQYFGWWWARNMERDGAFRIGSIYRQVQWEAQDVRENEQRIENRRRAIQNNARGGGNAVQGNQNVARGGGNIAQRGQNAPRGGGNIAQRGQNAPRGGGNNAQRGQNAPRGGGNIAQRVQNNGRNNRRGG